ncbi:uncharacterized protein LOC129919021 [Episyrphus balteatus]|uniref:uncharacterized protein LOC129919021 n=2 Tax=Episyrphus balteatus TaxID=286459 RepID=UPI0024866C04|nr:uncharacterized protein LOC129919021 [Episyrphus balteatus]
MAYVDDHLTSIPRNKIDMVKTALESFDKDITFTYESEDILTNEINYLDVTVKRNNDGQIMTNWYHKPIASNRLLNYYSAHPIQMKFNMVKNFIRKVFTFSHKSFWNNNLIKIKNILSKNNYPVKIIDKLISSVKSDNFKAKTDAPQRFNLSNYSFLSNNNDRSCDKLTSNNRYIYSSKQYIPKLSESISKVCQYFVPEVKLAMKPTNQNSKFFVNTKKKINKIDNSGVVYSIKCNDCTKLYVGETIQKLGSRIDQHKNECKKVIEGSNTKNVAALAEHVKQYGHSFDFDGAKILKFERNKLKLQIQEVNQIIKNEQIVCNYKTDKKDYTNTYYNLIVNRNVQSN